MKVAYFPKTYYYTKFQFPSLGGASTSEIGRVIRLVLLMIKNWN
jgi:hypothetical protein